MLTAVLLAFLAAPPASPSGRLATGLPGLEWMTWGMGPAEVQRRVEGFAWLGQREADGGGMAGARTRVAGQPAIITMQFGRGHLAVVFVVFDRIGDDATRFARVDGALTASLGAPSVHARERKWRTRTSVLTHSLGEADGATVHVIAASDRRRPDYGDPSPNYISEK